VSTVNEDASQVSNIERYSANLCHDIALAISMLSVLVDICTAVVGRLSFIYCLVLHVHVTTLECSTRRSKFARNVFQWTMYNTKWFVFLPNFHGAGMSGSDQA
jgi:hypothetical protein